MNCQKLLMFSKSLIKSGLIKLLTNKNGVKKLE